MACCLLTPWDGLQRYLASIAACAPTRSCHRTLALLDAGTCRQLQQQLPLPAAAATRRMIASGGLCLRAGKRAGRQRAADAGMGRLRAKDVLRCA